MIDIVQRDRGHPARGRQRSRIPAGEGRAVRLRRDYDAPIEDVWDALTNPERIGRWFLPISGDYRLGGRYQFEGNAGGEIVACERPNRLKVTWVYGERRRRRRLGGRAPPVGGRRGDDAVRARAHRDRARRDVGRVRAGRGRGRLGRGRAGAGAPPASGRTVDDPTAWQLSDEGREFDAAVERGVGSGQRGRRRGSRCGARGVANTIMFYAPPPEPTA